MALLRLPGLAAELLRVVVDLAELPDHPLLLRLCCRGGLVSINRCQLATMTGAQSVGQVKNHPATPDEIAQVVALYTSGLSLVGVSEKTRFSPKSVLHYLRAEVIQLRDTHGRDRP